MELLATRYRRIVFRIHAYRHFKELLVRSKHLARLRKELRVGLDLFQVALRHMFAKIYLERSGRTIFRKYRLRLAGRIRTPDSDGRHDAFVLSIIF